jgi:hypothetical protein
MEDWIFLRWNGISRDEKLFIRSGIMKLLENQSFYEELPAARTKLAKIIVEIAKRDFPQEWPSFLEEVIQQWSQDILSKSKVCSSSRLFLLTPPRFVSWSSNSSLRMRSILTSILPSLPNAKRKLLEECKLHFLPSCLSATDGSVASLNGNKNMRTQILLSKVRDLIFLPSHPHPHPPLPLPVTNDSPLSLFSPALQMLSSLILVAKADRLCEPTHDFSQVLSFSLSTSAFLTHPDLLFRWRSIF